MWYKDWFDSEFYHLLYKHRNEQEAELFIDQLIQKTGLQPEQKILDLPCGKGRHSVYLNKKGFVVSAADLSENSIKFAEQFSNPALEFRVHNMLDPYPENDFDAVFNLFTSFGYFEKEEDDLKALKNMKSALKKGGILIIDFFNANYVAANLESQTQMNIDGIQFTLNKKLENGFVYKTVTFNCGEHENTYNERVKLFSLSDFERLLNATGLQIISTFGDYSFRPYSPESSERLIIIAKN